MTDATGSRAGARQRVGATLCAILFLSGCAALLFETLWFRQAGLMLGNSVWTSSIVLASFMAGLAVGNAAAARHGARLARPVRAYAVLELVVGLTGLLLVWGWPALGPATAPLLAHLAGHPAVLDGARLGLAFALMGVPAAAMGATLPLMVSALARGRAPFGTILGWLYGWNTLGAVAGALLGETWLVAALGVRGTGCVAAALNLCAAGAAFALNACDADLRVAAPAARPPAPPGPDRPRPAAPAVLVASALAGGNLLALEVLWFRALVLNVDGTSPAFALMLAVVLAGIALGGLGASVALRRWPRAARFAPLVALLAGVTVVFGYATLPQIMALLGQRYLTHLHEIAWPSLHLMLPTCALSGALFTLLGDSLRAGLPDDARAAGLLTLANTLGALLGALLGGFVLLPSLGVEASLFAVATSYGLVALVTVRLARPVARAALLTGTAAYAVALAAFPFGLMTRSYLGPALDRWRTPAWEVIGRREGPSETVVYLRQSLWGQPVEYRLFTNGYSMSGTGYAAARYMRLFAYWASALHPAPRRALLISFGVGATAEALTDDARLRSIDVVDVSRDILGLGRLVFSDRPYPLDDPRVRVHVEDGRFFLLTSRESFDVITAEPPPPKNAGIVALYSREHFALIRARLAPGGIATYWLPVAQLTLADGKAVARAFCQVFEDCSLWTGFGPEWMLAGTRGAAPPGRAGFDAIWGRPAAAAALEAVGLSRPEQLGTTFLADGDQLRAWLGEALPVEDDHPQRLSPSLVSVLDPAWPAFAEPAAVRRRFEQSAWVARFWPPELRAATLRRFEREAPVQQLAWTLHAGERASLRDVQALLGDPARRVPALWALGSSQAVEQAALAARAAGASGPLLDLALGASALAGGRFAEAEQLLERAQPLVATPEVIVQRRVLALALDGQRERAATLMAQAWTSSPGSPGAADWRYLSATFGLPRQAGETSGTSAPHSR